MKSLEGNVLIVWRLHRLGRSLADVIRMTQDLRVRGVAFASLTGRIDTCSSTGQLVFHTFGALAEFKRNLIREQTMAGVKSAGARGRKGGGPRELPPGELNAVRALLRSSNVPVSTIAEQFPVSRSMLYRNVGTSA